MMIDLKHHTGKGDLPAIDHARRRVLASGQGVEGSSLVQSPTPGPADAESEGVWIDVIRKMDETYADLVAQQVELERKNAELEEAQAFIAGVMAAMTDVLLVSDMSGRIVQVNTAAERAFGRAGATLSGVPLADLLAPGSQGAVAQLLAAAARHEQVSDMALVLRGVEGAFPVAVNSSIRYTPRGRPVGLVLVGRPTGELRRAYERLKETQQQLVHSEKMASLGRLVAGVAHELNNPISFVYGNAHALRRQAQRLTAYIAALDAGRPAAEARAANRIDKALADLPSTIDGLTEGAERVRDIVAELRRFAATDKAPADVFDLSAVVQAAVGWVARAQMPDLDVCFDLPPDFAAFGLSAHTHQVVMNLVQNAIDAMAEAPPPHRLLITGRIEGGQAVVEIRDSGPGIATDVLPRIFDPFFTTKPVGKGTGLGLSISDRIVSEQGGALSAANHKDGGAVFTLRLPAPAGRRS